MKRAIKGLALFAALAMACSAGMAALASPEGLEYWSRQWELGGYPEDFGGDYYDQDASAPGILVANPTPERLEELRAMLGEDVPLTPCKYSFDELSRVNEEIVALMSEPDSKIYGTGVGWRTEGDDAAGFGESGKEFRVAATVDESMVAHYTAAFARLYGDMVYVEAGGPIVLGRSPSIAISPWAWVIAGIALLGLPAIVLWLILRRRKAPFVYEGGARRAGGAS